MIAGVVAVLFGAKGRDLRIYLLLWRLALGLRFSDILRPGLAAPLARAGTCCRFRRLRGRLGDYNQQMSDIMSDFWGEIEESYLLVCHFYLPKRRVTSI